MNKIYSNIILVFYIFMLFFTPFLCYDSYIKGENLKKRGKVIYGKVSNVWGLNGEKIEFKYRFKGVEYTKI